MSDKLRSGSSANNGNSGDNNDEVYSARLAKAGESVESVVASALGDMANLGLSSADEFLRAAQQTGGQ